MQLKKVIGQASMALSLVVASLITPASALAQGSGVCNPPCGAGLSCDRGRGVCVPTPAGASNIKNTSISPGQGFADNIGGLLNGILSFVMVIAALLVFFYLIWGGIEWITSGGDKGKTESARNKITAAVIGIIVLAAAYAILQVILNFLGFNNVNDIFTSGVDITGGNLEIN